ncbi:MAG: hypothetical protein JRG90_08790 [Deltaproteobacteria bacterium]|nr:hypothetical protein [Deltaproteobacteria bacterium]
MAAWNPEHRTLAPGLSRAHRIALAILCGVFAVGVATELHGYSLGGWRAYLGDDAALQPLLGKSRPIRSDDWAVSIPLALAQRAHDPPFPVVNENIGRGQNMLAPVQAPVAHPVALFRPALWGYFLGDDTGIAWTWWFNLLGLIAVWSCVFASVGRGRSALALAAAVALAYAPFFQFWSLNLAPAAIFAGAVVLGAQWVFAAARPRDCLLGGVLLGWAAGAFGLVLYPPAMAVLAQVAAVLAVAGIASSRSVWGVHADGVAHPAWRAVALDIAAVITFAAAWAFLDGARDALELVNGSVYPGHRTATGGDLPWWQAFSSNLWLAWWTEDFGPMRNLCEAASFPLFFPLIGAALAIRWWRGGERPDGLAAALLLYCAFLAIYQQWGFPEWLARATGLGFAPARRTLLGSGLADALLLVRFLSAARGDEASRVGGRAAAALLALGWGALLAAVAKQLTGAIPGLPLAPLLAMAGANAAVAYAILTVRRPERFMAVFAAAAVVGSVWFNPLARGGAAALRENELAAAILAIDAEHAGESVFITYGSPKLPNLVWALGVHGLNGTHTTPQLALWRELDPLGRFEDVYNRYAHVQFSAGPGDVARFQAIRHDSIRVVLNPLAPVLRRELGATHLLLRAKDEDRGAFERRTGLAPVFVEQRNAIYALPRIE